MSQKSTTEQLQEVLREGGKQFEGASERLERIREKVNRLEAEGKMEKGEYSLPPLDTIGRRMYGSLSEARRTAQE